MVEHLLAKERVTGSNPVFRSKGDVAKWLRRGSAKSLSAVRIRPSPPSPLRRPKWRNRQTRRSQKPLGGNPLVGSTPTFGTLLPYQIWESGHFSDQIDDTTGSSCGANRSIDTE